MSSVSSPMPSSSATAAFELPAMPGSYEDFEFSLNLPENITASDFSLVATPEFSSLFGMPMSSFGESASAATTAANVGAPSGGGLFTPALTPSATTTHWKMSAPGTPRGVGTTEAPLEDTVMSHSFSTTSQPQPISMPMGAMTMPTGPPPQPTSAPFFSFDQLSAQAPGLPVPNANARALFDASEAHFLTNFLSGFEGWDFNPNLPLDLPSFADAEKSAVAMGSPTVYTDNARRNNHRARASGGGAGNGGNGNSARNRGSPYGAAYASHASPGRTGMENVNAAFGLPMQDWHSGGGGEDSDMNAATTSRSRQSSGMTGKKIKTEHGSIDGMRQQAATAQSMQQHASEEPEKRNNHILSEQRRRNHIREAFKELVDLLEAGRDYGARGLGLSSGAGTGIEDEGLDDRSDYESTLEDEEPSAATKRRKLKARRRAALEAARKAGATGHAAAAAFINGGGRGKGRGRGGSAGGGAGSKSAVLFQAVDLLHWLDGRNSVLAKHIETLEDAVAQP